MLFSRIGTAGRRKRVPQVHLDITPCPLVGCHCQFPAFDTANSSFMAPWTLEIPVLRSASAGQSLKYKSSWRPECHHTHTYRPTVANTPVASSGTISLFSCLHHPPKPAVTRVVLAPKYFRFLLDPIQSLSTYLPRQVVHSIETPITTRPGYHMPYIQSRIGTMPYLGG